MKNCFITLFFFGIATLIAFWFFHNVPENPANIALVYITALVLVARFTTGYFFGIIGSLIGVVCVNFLFTYPYFALNFSLTNYPVTFLFMLIISITISAMTTQIKTQGKVLLEREKLLMEAEKEKMRANLLRSISHDLRTPLTGIIGNTSAYIDNKDKLSDEEKLDIVTHINEDSNWLLNMVENLLSVTRIDERSMKIAKSEESVEEVVAEAFSRLQKRLPHAQISVKVPEDFLMIPMDAMLIEQVIINLLENAVVHANSKKPIEFTVTENANQVTFQVKDYGIGIAPERLSTIFDGTPYTSEQVSDMHKGIGIGLSICKTIIVAHSGTIHATNHENGCIFTFTLPKEGK
ncbi:MAG: DUF4118 domain-containing protein [Lachnospiraceae bacterium]|nr:DUF4118 domain-containing protein [Lachnospiraceae bacterium]